MLTFEEIKEKIKGMLLDEEIRSEVEVILARGEEKGDLSQEDRELLADLFRLEADINRHRAQLWEETTEKLLEIAGNN